MNPDDLKACDADRLHEKWRLLGMTSLALTLMTLAILMPDPNVEGIRRAIRVTARTSLILFLLAFTASAAVKHFPNPWTRWQRRNRRYLGLGFVVSHALHAAAIAAYMTLFTAQFQSVTENANLIPNFVAYGFILLMALTSFDSTAAMIGPRAWKIRLRQEHSPIGRLCRPRSHSPACSCVPALACTETTTGIRNSGRNHRPVFSMHIVAFFPAKSLYYSMKRHFRSHP